MDGAEAIKYILENNIGGAIIECGVQAGHIEDLWITELLKQNNTFRDIYMYDTFAGLVKPTEHDYTCENNTSLKMNADETLVYWKNSIIDDKTNAWCYAPLDYVKNRLNATGYPQDKLHYIVGDVMETLKDKSNIPEKIAILRLDTDWYESSKYELEQMYNNVVPGGVIIFDDYYFWEGQRRATDEFFKSINVTYDFVDICNEKTAAIIKK
jgi:hypothetical protein